MLKVCYSDVGQFLAELRARPPDVERLVRVTDLWKMTDHFPLQHLSVLATYVRNDGGVPRLVELMVYCGQTFAGDPARDPQNAQQRAERVRDQLLAAIAALDLPVAGGYYAPGAS